MQYWRYLKLNMIPEDSSGTAVTCDGYLNKLEHLKRYCQTPESFLDLVGEAYVITNKPNLIANGYMSL